MTRPIHDNFLVSYEVRCKDRVITLYTEHDYEGSPKEFTSVRLTGVQAYCLEDDAFGNIINGLDEVPVEKILEEHQKGMAESYRMSGAPGPWATDMETAKAFLSSQGAKGFLLSSSLGMSGWIIAQDMTIFDSHTVPVSETSDSAAD